MTLPAELDSIPVLAAAGAIVPLGDKLLLFPPGEGESHFYLREDDGVTLDGPVTRLYLTLRATPQSLDLHIEPRGDYPLSRRHFEVILPPGDLRPLVSTNPEFQLTVTISSRV